MRGKLIVIDGVDSSGKDTQTRMLEMRLLNEGRKVMRVEFPNYAEPSSALVKMYLAGEFGSRAADVNPYAASAFYAVDRFASYKKHWESFFETGGVVLCDRYTTSNAIHQGVKIPEKQRNEYFDWLYSFEFNKMNIPAPDLVIFLDMPPAVSIQLMENRKNKATGGEDKDIHERDREYLYECYDAAKQAANHYGWETVSCLDGQELRSIEDINNQIYALIQRII